jgi:hypothetical protein
MQGLKRVSVAAVAGLAVIVGGAGNAWAHYVYQAGVVATIANYCVHNRSEVSHGGYGHGYIKVDTTSQAKQFYVDVNCTDPFIRPAGYLRAAWQYYYRANTSAAWSLCAISAETYNSSSSAKLVISKNWTYRPCGNGYYATFGETYLKDNNTWYGGELWSGAHFIPA